MPLVTGSWSSDLTVVPGFAMLSSRPEYALGNFQQIRKKKEIIPEIFPHLGKNMEHLSLFPLLFCINDQFPDCNNVYLFLECHLFFRFSSLLFIA
jgi:hypothetical protein